MSGYTNNDDIATFINTVPPPPYPGNDPAPHVYDLTPTPQIQNRPRLPELRNTHLSHLPDDVTIVKFQTIVREAREIVVGRIKVPTPGNNPHAFILRRYDTDAISLTTMYKVAFPGATEEDERREMDWVRSSYDTSNTNGSRDCDAVRLAGQWVSRHLALHLAPAYGITELVAALSRAVPDPNVAYRKSQRSQSAMEDMGRRRPTETEAPVKRQRQDERQFTLEATTTITSPSNAPLDVDAEIESAKQLVQDLKRDMQVQAAAGEAMQDQGFDTGESSRGTKRGQDEDDTVVSGPVVGRVIKSNKRMEKAETAKKVGWGMVIFGLGVGAAFLPQLGNLF